MMRCLTIAKELVRLGESVTFFVADEESEAALGSMAADITVLTGNSVMRSDVCGIYVVVLGSNWQDMEAELPVFGKELSNLGVSLLLVDSYKVMVPYFEKLKELCPVAYIDDLHEDTYPVDILINYSGYYKDLGYEDAYKSVTGHEGLPTMLLLGLEYAPLREQFYRVEENIGETGDETKADGANSGNSEISILLASGGADSYGMLIGTLETAEEIGLVDGPGDGEPVKTWHVVAGALCKDADALDAFAASHPTVHIHRSVTDMAGLMRRCDLAVCAAGTMLTECAAVELPAIFYQVADNQRYNVDFFGSTGGMIFAGDVNDSKEATLQNICGRLKALLTKEGELERMKASLSGLTDGRGAIRIAKDLWEMAHKFD